MELRVERLCCVRLSHAGLVVGFLTSIVGFLNIVDLIGALFAFDDREPGFHMNSHKSMDIIGWEILGYSLVLLSGCLLILGTIKKSHRLIVPWLILSFLAILFGIGCALLFLILAIFDNRDNDFEKLFMLNFLGILVFPGLGIYIWIGIFSLYSNIREKNLEAALGHVDARKLCDLPLTHSNCQTLLSSKQYADYP